MVTEIHHSDGDGVPAPTFAVYPFTPDHEFYKSKVDECVKDYKTGKQSIYLTNTSTGPSCIHSLQNLTASPYEMGWGVKTWKRVFNLYSGWFYIRYGIVDMKKAFESTDQHLVFFSQNKSQRYQIMIHDKNEYAFGDVYTKLYELKAESKAIYVKIKKTTMTKNCKKSSSYSFRGCVENFLVKVKPLIDCS